MKKHKIELTGSQIDHIINLLVSNAREGSYYGSARQYWNRHKAISMILIEAKENRRKHK